MSKCVCMKLNDSTRSRHSDPHSANVHFVTV